MTHRDAHQWQRQAAILDVADRLRRELGWSAVTVDQVARCAGLRRTSVYLEFRSKTDIHFALIERALYLARRRLLRAAREHRLGLDKILAMSRTYVGFAVEERHSFAACSEFMTLHTAGARPSPGEAACLAELCQIHACFAEAVTRGHRDGTVSVGLGAPNVVSMCLWALLQGSLQRNIAHSEAIGVIDDCRRVWLEHTLRLVRRMLQGSSIVS